MNNHLFIFLGGDEKYDHNPVMVQPKMPNQNWESRLEIEFLEFDGSLDHEEFVDWLSQAGEIFACYDIPEFKKVKLAATNLRGKARSWWEQLKIQRLREGKTKIQTWEKLKQKLRKQFFPYSHIQTHYSNLHHCWTNSNAANREMLIETQQTKRSQPALFNSITSPSGGAASNFTKHWRQPTMNVEIGSNTTGSNEVSKVPAKNQPVLSKGKTLVVEELEDQDLLVEAFEDQDLLVEKLEDHDMGQPIFDNYIEE